ncbi:MAG TPA: lysine biosynthesis protein LysW [Streptosporangiaceae bacterium]|jgi:alpha-aminoadipate carrier protein LysW
MTPCPVCETPIDTPDSSRLSEVLECSDCRSELEVVALDPVMLALAPEVEEDWGE